MDPEKSKAFTINKADMLKIAKGAAIAAGGAVCTYLLSALPGVNFGSSTPIVVAVVSIILNAGLKFFQGGQS